MIAKIGMTLLGTALSGLLQVTPSLAQTGSSVYSEMDTGTYALVVRTQVADDKRAAFLALIRSREKQARSVPGVVDFRVFTVAGDRHGFVSFESFRSKAAFDAFSSSPESSAFLKKMAPLVARPPEAMVLDEWP